MDNETRAARIKDAAHKTREALYAQARLAPQDFEYITGETIVKQINKLDLLWAELPAEAQAKVM